jgi:hypothetical protein
MDVWKTELPLADISMWLFFCADRFEKPERGEKDAEN